MNKPAVAAPLVKRIEPSRTAPRTSSDERALAAMFADLRAQDKDIQADAARRLADAARADVQITDRLLQVLAGPRPRARWGAAYALALSGTAPELRWQPALIEALATEDGDVRWAAADLLIALGREYPAPVEHTLLALLADPAPNRRKMALYCIRDLGLCDGALVRALRAAVKDHSTQVRLAALAALKRMLAGAQPAAREHREAMEQLVLELLAGDPEPAVRRTAAALLAALEQPSGRVQTALRATAGAADPALRKIAARALG